jgi:Transposase DDE domain
VPGAAEQIAAVCTGHDYSEPGKPKTGWDDPAAKDALVCVLVNDASAVAGAFAGVELDEEAASALALLALVAGQDVEPAEGSDGTDGRWRIARQVAEDRVISVHDPDGRHTRKSGEARRDGYRAHLAADPETGIITDEKLTKASGEQNSDPAVAAEFLTAAHDQHATCSAGPGPAPGPAEPPGGAPERQPLSWYADSAYGTGDLRDAIGQAGDAAVIKPQASGSRGRGRAHPGRLHRQRGKRHRHLPRRDNPAHHRPPQRHLRSRMPRLPAARPLHHQQGRPPPRRARTR